LPDPKERRVATTFDRRSVLKTAAALGLLGTNARQSFAAGAMKLGPAVPFSFDTLKAMARSMAREPYAGPARPSPDIVAKINYEAWGNGSCPVRRWAGPVSGELFSPGNVFS
jgi:glucan biosynthesis protein